MVIPLGDGGTNKETLILQGAEMSKMRIVETLDTNLKIANVWRIPKELSAYEVFCKQDIPAVREKYFVSAHSLK